MSRASVFSLIVANLIVAVQAVRHEWGYYELILTYWVEVVIIGGYNVLRLLVVGLIGAAPLGKWLGERVDLGGVLNRLVWTILGVGFFVVKFGGFAIGIGLMVALLPAFLKEAGAGSSGVLHALRMAGPGLLTSAGVLCLSHGISFVRNFLARREYDRFNMMVLAFWPYARMTAVGVVLVGGLVLARIWPGLGGRTGFAVVIVLLKLCADLATHALEHRSLATELGSG